MYNFSVPAMVLHSLLDIASSRWGPAIVYLGSSFIHLILAITKVGDAVDSSTFVSCVKLFRLSWS